MLSAAPFVRGTIERRRHLTPSPHAAFVPDEDMFVPDEDMSKLTETGRIVVGADACRVLRVACFVADEVPEGRLAQWETLYVLRLLPAA
jgi:hypothetical protein